MTTEWWMCLAASCLVGCAAGWFCAAAHYWKRRAAFWRKETERHLARNGSYVSHAEQSVEVMKIAFEYGRRLRPLAMQADPVAVEEHVTWLETEAQRLGYWDENEAGETLH